METREQSLFNPPGGTGGKVSTGVPKSDGRVCDVDGNRFLNRVAVIVTSNI